MSAALIINDVDDLSSLASYWRGNWSLHREITIYNASMNGVARFHPTSQHNCLDYTEKGDLVLKTARKSFDATRCYTFECAKNGVTVFFGDGKDKGKVFQNLKPEHHAPGIFTGTHLCVDDRYDTAYEIIDNNRFTCIHRVKGPAKEYVSKTVFTRSPSTL